MADKPSDSPSEQGLRGLTNKAANILGDKQDGEENNTSLLDAFRGGASKAMRLGLPERKEVEYETKKKKKKKTKTVGCTPVDAALLLAIPTFCLSTFGYDNATRAYIGTDDSLSVTLEDKAGYHAVTASRDTYVLIQDEDGKYSLYIDNHRRLAETDTYNPDTESNRDRAELIYVQSPERALHIAQSIIERTQSDMVSYSHYSSLSNIFQDPDGFNREGFNRENNIGLEIPIADTQAKSLERWKEFEAQIKETGYKILDEDDAALSFSFEPMEHTEITHSFGDFFGLNYVGDRLPSSIATIYGSWLALGLLGGLGGAAGQAARNAATPQAGRRRRRPQPK